MRASRSGTPPHSARRRSRGSNQQPCGYQPTPLYLLSYCRPSQRSPHLLALSLSLLLPPSPPLSPPQVEETKVLRLQLELTQVRGELERKLQEKEEEAEAAR